MRDVLPNKEAIEKLNELISNMDTAMLTTVDKSGDLHSRPMITQTQEFTGELWFFTEYPTDKTSEIESNPDVNVSYSANNTYVSLAGRARVVHDDKKKKELWTDNLKVWFENGPEDNNVALIHFIGRTAQYWDSPSNIVGKAIARVRVILTGNEDAASDSDKVKL